MTQNISQGERIHSIDIIRGIAVLGIFLVNWQLLLVLTSRIFQGVYEWIRQLYSLIL